MSCLDMQEAPGRQAVGVLSAGCAAVAGSANAGAASYGRRNAHASWHGIAGGVTVLPEPAAGWFSRAGEGVGRLAGTARNRGFRAMRRPDWRYPVPGTIGVFLPGNTAA